VLASKLPTGKEDVMALATMSVNTSGITTPAAGRVLARPSTSLAPRIVILGGGFAGVTAALELAQRCTGFLPVHVTLISNQNFFLFTPMLAEAATGAV
jgi:NADPH-dependent 2,4-dienoyl-CoA reductase/sulfur reductase-like enzyme